MTSANSPSPSLCFSIWEMDLGVSWVQTHEGSVKTGTCRGLTPQARGKQRPGGHKASRLRVSGSLISASCSCSA